MPSTREIKFRAWTGKKMYFCDSVDHPATEKILGTPVPKLYYLPMSWLLGDSNDWVWMQYTGLKDKNGKEIYEGDVVTNGHEAMVIKIESIARGCLPFIEVAGPGWQSASCDEVEVIGNIYETPELLKEENAIN